jgi:hypothetical protein
MDDEEKKPNYGGWVLGVFGAFLLYVLSFGPAIAGKFGVSSDTLVTVYEPVFWLMRYEPIRVAMDAYLEIWAGWRR